MSKHIHTWSNTTFRQPVEGSQTLGRDTVDIVHRLQMIFLHTANLDELLALDHEERRRRIERLLEQLIEREGIILSPTQYTQVITFLLNEALGYGPLSPLVADPSISEIMVNGADCIFELLVQLGRRVIVFVPIAIDVA